MRSTLLLVLLLVAGGGCCFAFSDQLVIRGTAEDQTGAAIPGAIVELSATNRQKSSTSTDSAGSFRFDDVSTGSYVVTIRHDGFEPKTVHISVGSRSPAPLKVILALAELRQDISHKQQWSARSGQRRQCRQDRA